MRQTDTAAVSISYAKIGIYASAFLIPALFSAPQWVTGTVVNALLFMAALKLSKKDLVIICVLPSLGAVTHGVLFGPQTVFLYYFLPFIWVSNYVLVRVFAATKRYVFFVRVIVSSVAKYLVLAAASHVYFRSGIVPAVFVTSMGIIQLITAVSGGLLMSPMYERSKHSH